MVITPTFIEKSRDGKTAIDVYTKLLDERIVFIFGEITADMACSIIAQLLLLETSEPKKDIQLYINSPGGSVTAGLAIYDVMKRISCDIATMAVGSCASMAAVLLAAGTPGKRYGLEHSEVMIHQPLGGTQGQCSDILIHAERISKTRDTLNELLSKFTGKDKEQIALDTERDKFFDAAGAKEYGLIDHIV